VNYRLKDEYIRLSKKNRLYHLDIPVVGLTGGVATGKSTVSSFFKKEGFNIINADSLVHNIYQKKESLDFIQKNYPTAFIKGSIDFKILRKIFFENKKSQEQIENFIYQRLEEAFLDESKNLKNLIIYDVPLLFEKGLEEKVDISICVYSSVNNQIKRLMERDKIDEKLAREIIQKQMDIEKKRKLSNFVINNDNSLNETMAEFIKLKNLLFFN
jgi:dephospho-CoA kinase